MTNPGHGTTVIRNVRLPSVERYSGNLAWDITCLDGRVQNVTPSGSCIHDNYQGTLIDADGGVLIPSYVRCYIHHDYYV